MHSIKPLFKPATLQDESGRPANQSVATNSSGLQHGEYSGNHSLLGDSGKESVGRVVSRAQVGLTSASLVLYPKDGPGLTSNSQKMPDSLTCSGTSSDS